MFPMITTSSHEYAGRKLAPGDKFEAESEQHVTILRALKRAEPQVGVEDVARVFQVPEAMLVESKATAPAKKRKKSSRRRTSKPN